MPLTDGDVLLLNLARLAHAARCQDPSLIRSLEAACARSGSQFVASVLSMPLAVPKGSISTKSSTKRAYTLLFSAVAFQEVALVGWLLSKGVCVESGYVTKSYWSPKVPLQQPGRVSSLRTPLMEECIKRGSCSSELTAIQSMLLKAGSHPRALLTCTFTGYWKKQALLQAWDAWHGRCARRLWCTGHCGQGGALHEDAVIAK
jgi:hypothetical protein